MQGGLSLPVSPETPMALRGDVVATVLDDGALLLDLHTKYFYLLNSSAWTLVQPFEEGTTLDQVRKTARASGAVDEEPVDKVVELLVSDGLVVACEHAVAAPAALLHDWSEPTIQRQAQPLQRVMVSAFDPTVPLAE
jgi:hypothetical protein